MNHILVADLMTREPITAKPDDDLLTCAKKMVRKRVESLIIVEKDKFVGFISQKDILWALVKKSDLSKVKAKDISPRKIITIKPSETIGDAITKINKFKFNRFPVVQDGKIKGVITLKDILKLHPEVYSQLKEIDSIREEAEKIKRLKHAEERVEVQDGICGECGERRTLYKEDGILLCSSCLSSI